MKIKWGALVVDGRGKLGGHVASQNGGGSYLRTKVTPTNPQSTYQSEVRGLFGQISGAWSGMGQEAIRSWNSAVDEWKQTNIFGDLKAPSGKALFQRLNQQAQIAGFPKIELPPAKQDMVQGIITEGAISIGGETITLTGAYALANARVMYFASPPVSAGTSFVKNLMRHIGGNVGNNYSPGDAFENYVERFGTPVLGQKIFVGVKYVLETGQASPLQIVETIVGA